MLKRAIDRIQQGLIATQQLGYAMKNCKQIEDLEVVVLTELATEQVVNVDLESPAVPGMIRIMAVWITQIERISDPKY